MVKGLHHIGPLEECEYRMGENPVEDIWHLIDLSTSEEMITQYHSQPPSQDIMTFITESIMQAQEFKSAVASSGEHTKPLQLYYCFHNLTKAILALENKRIPIGYHGLKNVEIPSSMDLLEMSVQLDQGVFWDLLLLIGKIPKRDLRITFDEMLERCAYMVWEYEVAYNKKPIIIIPKLDCNIKYTELEIDLPIPFNDFVAKWQDVLPSFAKYFELKGVNPDSLRFALKDNAPKGSLSAIRSILDETIIYSVLRNPDYFLLPITNADLTWPQEAYLYALSFILCSLVRYYPDYWHREVITKRKNRWVVRSLNRIMERVYPNMMLNIMFGRRVKFVSSSFF